MMIKKVTFDTYPIILYIFIGCSDEDILAYIGKENIEQLTKDLMDFDDNDEALFAYHQGDPHIAIRLRNVSKPEIIAHEALHATAYIMRYVGIKFSKTSEEAYAYLLQYIVDNIFD